MDGEARQKKEKKREREEKKKKRRRESCIGDTFPHIPKQEKRFTGKKQFTQEVKF